MKKIVLVASIVLALTSCQKESSSSVKTGFVDTSKIFKEYVNIKEFEDSLLAKSEKAGKSLDSLGQAFQAEVAYFQQNAKAKGQQWAQQKQNELMQKDQQLKALQQQIGQGLQEERAMGIDSIFKNVKTHVSEYAKKNGYTYIYGTGESASIMYGKEELDLTDVIIKELNGGKTVKAEPAKEEAKK